MKLKESTQNEYQIIAYLSDWSDWKEEDIDVSKLTHINYAFGVIVDGEVQGSHLKKVHTLSRLKERNPKLKTVLSIGGWGADGFSDAALTEEGRNLFSQTAVDFMMANNFDGLDIDWEYPCSDQAGIVARAQDRKNFTLMLKNLRDKLDRQGETDSKHYLLTIALGASQKCVDDVEMSIIHNYLDFVNIMTYDMRGSFTNFTGHHTNLYSPKEDKEGISGDKTVNMLLLEGVPREKIILGAAFYSRIWEKVKNEGNGYNVEAETTGGSSKDYTTLVKEYINKNGFIRYWDNTAKAPYLFNGSSFVSYEDEESLNHKSEYIIKKGLGGIMFWEYSLDKTGNLINSIFSVLKEK
jgi:chitinase